MAFSLEEILGDGIASGASDIHLDIGSTPILRIDGELVHRDSMDKLTADNMNSIMSAILNEKQIKELRERREYDFGFSVNYAEKGTHRFRANFSYDRGNPVLALRIISPVIRTIDQLCLPQELKEIAQRNQGLFLVTGPTGSGKSTTLAAVIREINMTRAVHIITIEDPIEYIYNSERALIHQREVGSDTESFAEAIKRAMRQDPDVILIGEMRDLETISAAITAAETGHFVLATLHTPDAPQTIDRIIDVFPPYQQQQIRVQLASILTGVLSQQLIPVASGKGRLVATELLIANSAVKNSIRDSKTSQIKNAIQTGSASGMHTMDQELARMYKSMMITKEEAMVHAIDIKEFQRFIMM